ncbi:MAG: DNA internalization-related competence protein ComEC/Rec2 [Cellulosilyticaceae bacterium]
MASTEAPFILLCIVAILGIAYISYYYKSMQYGVLIIFVLVGMFWMNNHYLSNEWKNLIGEQTVYGTVTKVQSSEYDQKITLKNVVIEEKDALKKYKSRVIVSIKKNEIIEIGDKVVVKGFSKRPDLPMNPSDMNYRLYLLGEGVSVMIRATDVEVTGNISSNIQNMKKTIEKQIIKVFEEGDQGIMSQLLIGEKSMIDSETKKLYTMLGIGHVLAISGLHIGVFFGLAWWICGELYIKYSARIILAISLTWIYTFMIGMPVSAVRATMVLTILYLGKLILEEGDAVIALALAGTMILLNNPYQLFQAGFQLSFTAYSGVILVSELKRKWKQSRQYNKRLNKYVAPIIMNIIMSIVIMPILAWYFYEVPVLAVFLNLLIIPIYAVLVPLGIALLVFGIFFLPLAQLGGMWINTGLSMLTNCLEWLSEIPLMTVVTGRPEWIVVVCVYVFIGIAVAFIFNWKIKQHIFWCGICMYISYSWQFVWFNEPQMSMTQLYIGQGDCSVIITPRGKAIIIDGGSFGKENTLLKFLKYKGITNVEKIIVSHAHEDHIGGIIGLLEERILISEVIMPKMEPDNELEEMLLEVCEEKNVPFKYIEGNEIYTIDGVNIRFYLPGILRVSDNANDYSAVCRIEYGMFGALFTGDLEAEQETNLLPYIDESTVLKIGHHGSKTSSQLKFLEQVNPKYGIISCGINNRYNHPANNVLADLESIEAGILRTDLMGAIEFVTNGEKFVMKYQLQEEK